MKTKTPAYPLRIPASMRSRLEKVSAEDGSSMNQFILLAVAEKLAVLEAESFFAERRKRGDLNRLRQFLNREGGEPPRPGDEILPDDGEA
jgi:hypothetical protein